jgi:hypothetical protein
VDEGTVVWAEGERVRRMVVMTVVTLGEGEVEVEVDAGAEGVEKGTSMEEEGVRVMVEEPEEVVELDEAEVVVDPDEDGVVEDAEVLERISEASEGEIVAVTVAWPGNSVTVTVDGATVVVTVVTLGALVDFEEPVLLVCVKVEEVLPAPVVVLLPESSPKMPPVTPVDSNRRRA